MGKLARGYLEEITESWQCEDIEDTVTIFNDCWRSYNQYLSDNLAQFPSEVHQFVEDYVLGGLSPKRLHGDLLSRADFSFRTRNDAVRDVKVEVLQRSLDPESLLLVSYFDVSEWDFPVGEPHLLIDRHELFHVEDGFQHNIYFVGCAPARITFKRLSASSEDSGQSGLPRIPQAGSQDTDLTG